MTSEPVLLCCRLEIGRRILADFGRKLGLSEPADALHALGRAIASGPAWDSAPDAVVMVRLGSAPCLAVMGRFDDTWQSWLRAQAVALARDCARLRLVDYRQVERDCERLASMLVDRLGRGAIRRARFVAIPRGGFIVLGLLATALGLDRAQLESRRQPGSPLIVVDDCALSGTRFAGFLRQHERDAEIVFAHLYSHPRLRAAVESCEPRVVACLSARDLGSDESLDRDSSTDRFLAQMPGAYWIGHTEILGFPWGEVDHLIWHSGEGRPVPAWRLVPPELCLKNRAYPPIPVQVQPEAVGPLRPAHDVIFGELEGRIVLHHLNRGKSAALDSVGSDIWRAVVKLGDPSKVTVELAREYAVPEAQLKRDAEGFIRKLIDRAYLVWRESSDDGVGL